MSRAITALRPELRELAMRWLTDCAVAGINVLVTCTFRSSQEQEELYKIGRTVMGEGVDARHPMGRTRTNARGGQSAHNFGLALDFVPMVYGKPEWSESSPLWMQAITVAERLGLESLAKTSFPELAHLQLPGWRKVAGIP